MPVKQQQSPSPPHHAAPPVSDSTSDDLAKLPYYAKNLIHGAGVERQTSTGLTFSRHWLKHLANETIEIAKNGYYINKHGTRVDVQDALERAIQNSQHYHSSHVFRAPSTSGPFLTTSSNTTAIGSRHPTGVNTQTILICYASSLQVARELVHHYDRRHEDAHVGVLSSASSKNPSKFLRGTVSQEEALCRSSLLYPCLSQYEFQPHHFYVINNKEKYRDQSSACAIFSPRVPVIRNDDSVQGELLDDYYTCSFVSIPAPNAFVLGRARNNNDDDSNNNDEHHHQRTVVPKAQSPGSSERSEPVQHITLQQAMRDRLFRALCIFANAGCTDLVLVAFGCGVHGNHPDTVAKLFRELLQKDFCGYFRTVVFAIQPSRTGNYKAFQAVFPEATAL